MTRLNGLPTLKIDPARSITFNYRGHTMKGCNGDSVATALYANGVRIFSRSLKYHRPRGLYSLDGESSNCMMTVDGLPTCMLKRPCCAKASRSVPRTSSAPRNGMPGASWIACIGRCRPVSFIGYSINLTGSGLFSRSTSGTWRGWAGSIRNGSRVNPIRRF